MKDTDKTLTIIGIGSSAGGLEAIRELVENLPEDLPVSYVVVQHMAPKHKSLMTELVARQTDMKVKDVEDGDVPQRNVMYITPPNKDVVFVGGKLRLKPPSKEVASPKPSVNRFLVSLAENYGEKSMGIILSGTGTDGSYGIQALREVGGITIAQDADSAKYDGMPNSAIQTGCVDLVLRPHDIGQHLAKMLQADRDFSSFRATSLNETPLTSLLHVLLARTRVDFRDYKQSTINRRVERRMIALGIEDLEEYVQFCRSNPAALDALFKDLLISVTRFFRDLSEFDRLQAALPRLIENAGDAPIRVWIAGCATGEEAYSIGMLLSEALGGPNIDIKSRLQIFATDIDQAALNVARRGAYGIGAIEDIPKHLAEKYIIHQNNSIRVVDNIRSAILFSDHNVCQDPPFQNIDLVCCRNVLIYFDSSLQRRVMSRFHYAMKPQGLLFLGTAESVAGSDEMFVRADEGSHVYSKRVVHTKSRLPYELPHRRQTIAAPVAKGKEASADRQLFEALAQSLGENSVLVADDYSIVSVNGDISDYIQINAGSTLKMHLGLLKSPLREEARSLVSITLKNGQHRAGVRHLLSENDEQEVRLDVYPVLAKGINESAALVVFNHVAKTKRSQITEQDDSEGTTDQVKHIQLLEYEVQSTREALQQTIEELETSNEELQSLNEELQSTNEELQATNEELETSNEELQSTNEELITVNEELQVTAAELNGRTSELASVLDSAPLAILVIDNALQITQATESAKAILDISRPVGATHISQCNLPDGFPNLAPICSEALQIGHAIEHEFLSGGSPIKLSCSPYFSETGSIQGVTLVISSFPGLARELELILNTDRFYLMHRTEEGEILQISKAAARTLGKTREELMGHNLAEIDRHDHAKEILSEDKELVASNDKTRHSTVKFQGANGDDARWIDCDNYVFVDSISDRKTVFSVGLDVTEILYSEGNSKSPVQ